MSKSDSAVFFSKFTLKEIVPNNFDLFYRIFDSLKFRNFKLYFWGQCISLIGSWMQQVAMSWLIYSLTGSLLLLGTVAFLAQIPTLLFTPFSGVIVDRYNKRKILMFMQIAYMVEAFILATLVLTHTIQTWHILLLALFAGFINLLDMPARQAFYTALVPPEKLGNAVALSSSIMNGSRLIGPAIAGILIKVVGEGGCFLINAFSYIFVIWALVKITCQETPRDNNKHVFSEIRDGFVYVQQTLPIRSLLFLLAIFSFCVFTYSTFMAAYVKDTLNADSGTLGIIMSAVGIGAFASTLYLAARKSILGLGKVVVITTILASVALIPFFFLKTMWATLPLAIFLGFGITCAIASINTLLQALTSDEMRGRVMAYYSMSFIGISALGCLFWSSISEWIGLPWTMTFCGIICIAAALLFEKYRPIVRKHARPIYIDKGIIKEIAIGIEGVRE